MEDTKAKRTYTVKYGCLNCSIDFEEKIEVGQEAPEKTVCPNCGCYPAYKKWQ